MRQVLEHRPADPLAHQLQRRHAGQGVAGDVELRRPDAHREPPRHYGDNPATDPALARQADAISEIAGLVVQAAGTTMELTCWVCRALRICSPLCLQNPSLARKQNARARSTQLIRRAQWLSDRAVPLPHRYGNCRTIASGTPSPRCGRGAGIPIRRPCRPPSPVGYPTDGV